MKPKSPDPKMRLLVTLIAILSFLQFQLSVNNAELSSNLSKCRSSGLSVQDCKSMLRANIKGKFYFHGSKIKEGSSDFGGLYHEKPVVFYVPRSVKEVSRVILAVGSSSNLSVAPRGNGHSTGGQAQALHGLVLSTKSLKGFNFSIDESSNKAYVDVGAGELWVDLLRFTLKFGFAPRSWTDYLDLTIGGTLSNAGISGQTFRFGPQISNVLQLEIVTGRGEIVTCNPKKESDIFNAALGGLGQFGVITKARIPLQRAPHRVRYIRVVYSEVEKFLSDQEQLISLPEGQGFDYVEGLVLANRNTSSGWNSVPFSTNKPFDPSLLPVNSSSSLLYCIELGLHYNHPTNNHTLHKKIQELTLHLGFIKGLEFSMDLSYFDFLYRVHSAEVAAKATGSWFAEHAWLALFVPRRSILHFNSRVFNFLLRKEIGGPILIYPVNKNRWNSEMSAVFPEVDDIFYSVSILRSVEPTRSESDVQAQLIENKKIVDICSEIGCNVYLRKFEGVREWERQFGRKKWEIFAQRKRRYDPKHLLTPGQTMFERV